MLRFILFKIRFLMFPFPFIIEICSEERNVIFKGLDTIRKGINRFGAHTIRIF